MAGADSSIFKIDTIVVDGKAVAFEDGSGTISGAARYENAVVPSASGRDYSMRKRVPTLLRLRLQFGPAVSVPDLAGTSGVQITARDTGSGRRALMNDCQFGSLGDLGNGAVDVTYNVLSPIEWL